MLTRSQLARNRYIADLPPSRAQSREPATACSPYGERRKARNRNTIPPMGVGVKKRAIPSTARITEAIVSRKAQISNRNTSRAARRDSKYLHHQNLLYSFYLYFIMPARGHKCCERLVNPVLKVKKRAPSIGALKYIKN